MSNPFDIEDLRKAERTIRFCRFRFANDKATLSRTEIFNVKEEATEIMDQAQGMLRMCMDLLGEDNVESVISKLVEGEEK